MTYRMACQLTARAPVARHPPTHRLPESLAPQQPPCD